MRRSFLLLLLFPLLLQAQGLQIASLCDNVYVYTTWQDFAGEPFPANGLYVLTAEGAVLIDSPWDTLQTRPLLDAIRARHGAEVRLCIATHGHDDRTGGFDQLRRWGIPTYASAQTRSACIELGNPLPQHVFLGDTTLTVGGVQMEWHWPGGGHTRDNIVVWLPAQRILYGGCLVKSVEAQGLGYTGDADLAAWPTTMDGLLRRYPQVRWTVPGHQRWVPGKRALRHTVRLLQKAAKK
jgi:metallo-beta-lactamase class B